MRQLCYLDIGHYKMIQNESLGCQSKPMGGFLSGLRPVQHRIFQRFRGNSH